MKSKKLFIALLVVLCLVSCNFLVTIVRAASSSPVTATVIAQNISISVGIGGSSPTFDYGTLGVGTTQNTVNLTKTIIASNDGNIAEKFNIAGASTTGCVWTLDSTTGTLDHYVHGFSKTGGPTYTALTAGYTILTASVGVGSTQPFDLQITVPSSSSCYTTATAVVTVQAAIPLLVD